MEKKKMFVLLSVTLLFFSGVFVFSITNGKGVVGEEIRNISAYTSVVDDEGNCHIIYAVETRPYEETIYYSKIDAEGHFLVKNREVKNVLYSLFRISSCLDNENNIILVWEGGYPSLRDVWIRKLDSNGETIAEYLLLTNGSYNSFDNAYLSVDSEDNIHIVWGDYYVQPGEKWVPQIRYSKISKNGTLLAEKVVVNKTTYQIWPYLTIDSQDNLHLIWGQGVGIEPWCDYFYLKLDNSGRPLINKTLLGNVSAIHTRKLHSDDSVDEDCLPVIKDDDGKLLYLAHGAGVGIFDSGAVDSDNHLVYVYSSLEEIRLQRFDSDGHLELNKTLFQLNAPKSLFMPVVNLDKKDNIHLLYVVNNGYNMFSLEYRKFDRNGTLSTGPIEIASEPRDIYTHPILYIALGGTAIVATATVIYFFKKKRQKNRHTRLLTKMRQ